MTISSLKSVKTVKVHSTRGSERNISIHRLTTTRDVALSPLDISLTPVHTLNMSANDRTVGRPHASPAQYKLSQ
ncbi:hypothetical protein DPMN_050165 [Dreissena polymorpha]|uniref:Uncharacterized protein n=1 Tax=Dreissena polymorpha TaxID=45954 RepID=A0A9D4CGM3_DREPO|nr:hypothetical protein DPMN_050165 [Dreissena polymorpha]